MRFAIPVLLAIVGAASGVGAGLYFQPASEIADHADAEHSEAASSGHSGELVANGHPEPADSHANTEQHDPSPSNSEFTKLNNQFVVPVLGGGLVKSMVVLSLSLETPVGKRELVFSREPRIRDTFLQVMFDHANAGGFDGEFTNGAKMDVLRQELRRAARQLLGADIYDVLITDIARQDIG